uniref:Gypsy retrotransposon integrase-like protein 1 n=1 Tax=Podarcis muralis TaxID=64176 RepID=A0A670IHI8_PODMU
MLKNLHLWQCIRSWPQVKPFWPQRGLTTQWPQVSLLQGPVTLRPLLICRGLGQRGEGNWLPPGGVLALRPEEAGLLGAGTGCVREEPEAMAEQAATLVALAQENQALTHTVQQLSDAVVALQQRLDTLPAPGADAPAPGKYPVALPEKFDGAPASFPMFLAQAKLYIQGRARNFPDDRTKVHFLISLLKDQAAKWALPLLRQDSPLLADYTGFCNRLEAAFGNPQKESQANRAIRRLKQGKSTVATYTTEFRLLAQDLTWNDSALRDQYLEGLSDEVLDQLATMERPTTLDTLIQRSLQIDDRLEDRSAGKPPTPVADGPSYRGSQTVQNGPAPMDLQHLMVSVRLYPPGGPWILTHALVDSGATRSYMDTAFATHHRVPLRNKPVPIQVEAIDGRLLRSGAVTQETQPLVLCLQQHRELRTLDIASMPRFPLVLGMDWLEAHNVQIDWVKRTVHFPDPCSHAQSGTLAAAPSEEAAPTLPAVYQDYQDVFEERGADQLPPRLYSLTEPERGALQDFLRKNLERGFIRPSTSPTAAPVLFVKKKCGELRPCHDYRALNKITVPDRYPLPLISELLERVQGAQVFTKLDLRGAYNLIRIRAGDEWKTAFGTRYGQFEYLVMPFGLCNAPAVFQRYINHVFQDLLDKYVVVYLDDILIYSRDPAHHEGHVRTVLQRLREHRLYAKLSKCEFHQRTVDFLGHRLSPDGVQMDPGKVTAVREWAAPRNRKDLQRFLGFANYYRTFIADYAHRTTPLTRLLRPKTPFSWDKEAEEAFQGLKACFQRAPILQHPDPSRPFVVETDASSTALGAVLSQQIGPEAPLLPCAFYSRQLLPAERNYIVWERELLAIKVAFEVWRHHLEGARHPVEVRTDHRNLEYLQTTRKLNQRQIRWALFFSRFQFRIRYIPSSQNQKTDALSRKPEDNADTVQQAEPTTILPPAAFLATQEAQPLQVRVREQQRVDAWAQDRLRELAEGSSPQYPGLVLHQGLLLHHGRLREFWWPRLKADVARYVAGCDVCRRAKGPTGRPPGLLQPLPVPPRPWHTVSLDFIVDLPSSRGCTCLLVFSDHFTKMVHCAPCPSVPTAKETAQLYLQHVFRLHGLPERVVSDRGVQSTSRFWRALHQTLGTEVCLSSAYHPQTDGQTERANAVLEQYLRCYCQRRRGSWGSGPPLTLEEDKSPVSPAPGCGSNVVVGFGPSCVPDPCSASCS